MTPRRTNGTSLLEVLLVVAVSAVLVTGAAAHFRSLRQVGDTTRARREALQNARVALDRIARHVRQAKRIDKMSDSLNTTGRLIVTGEDDIEHEFKWEDPGQIGYSVNKSEHVVLAEHVETLCFVGLDATGAVAHDETERMKLVHVALRVAIPGTTGALDLETTIRLRRDAAAGDCQAATYYASAHTPTAGAIANPANAFGSSDDAFAMCEDSDGGRFSGFDAGDDTGDISYLLAGFRLQHCRANLQIVITRGDTTLVSQTIVEADLGPWQDTPGWMWFDLTDLRDKWDEKDVSELAIEIRDPGPGNTEVGLDCFAIRAVYGGQPTTTTWWAAGEGGPNFNAEWARPDSACGAPDDAYAEGGSGTRNDEQNFRVSVPVLGPSALILHVRVVINGYLTKAPAADAMIGARAAMPIEPATAGTLHQVDSEYLSSFVGQANQGDILIDLTPDRLWTWPDLASREIRLQALLEQGNVIHADAVGWRVTYCTASSAGVSEWSEQ